MSKKPTKIEPGEPCEECGERHAEPDEATGIQTYVHCAKCLKGMPPGTSPRDYAKLEVGFMPDGNLRVWCRRHDCLVGDIRTAKEVLQ